jgi:EAL domain-containing protein (putative c-di-GMP-specific phosphodiesterase class I)
VTTPDVATRIADRLLEVLREPYQLGTHTVRSTASIGMVYSSAGYDRADEMLRDADIAMYEAKARGKACHVAFSTGMREAVRARVETENDLREALGTNQLHLVYQPIISLDDRTVCGAEALARWTHPTRGNISPDTFIPIAEETRLILPLSEWILREACETFMHWRRTAPGRAPDHISVNLSRIQFSDPQLVERTMRVVHETGMQPHQLQLEVTESQIMQERTVALGLLADFRARGVRLAMDDFGTGHSSLSCLQEFPLDVLKVDRSFVSNAKRGRDYAALLHAVVTLADNLGLKVVAEGIEDTDQLVLLQALGCAYGQGYLLARPMSSDAFERFIGVAAAA